MKKMRQACFLNKLILGTICLFINCLTFATNFHLQKGDLLFQDLNCGSLCNSIDGVTYGYHNSYVSHVAMVIGNESQALVIEAISQGVTITPLAQFLARSIDQNGHPRVMVGRLKPQYMYLIPMAIARAKAQLGKPYNKTFVPGAGHSYYCSELIDTAFQSSNQQNSFFHHYPMNFTDPRTKKILPSWQSYFAKLHAKIPQGMFGTNPGQMSRESSLNIIYFYGQLRIHQKSF